MDISLEFAVTLGTVLASAVGSLAATSWRAKRSETKVDELDKELTALRIEAASKYVTVAAMKEMESEFKSSVDRLTDRLNQVLLYLPRRKSNA